MVERTNIKLRKKLPFAAQVAGGFSLAFAGAVGFGATCGGSGNKDTKVTPENNPQTKSQDYKFPWADSETWYLNAGPHPDVGDKGVKNALDVAPREVVNCEQTPHGIIANRFVTAIATGIVTTSGNENDTSDPNHSIVRIKDNNGITENYVHLANIKVKKDETVAQGQILGSPSCEFPAKTGSTTGAHVHISISRDGVPIDITTQTISGWSIQSIPSKNAWEHNGIMTKDGEVRTANIFRCGPEALPLTSVSCRGTRNDLSAGSNLVLAPTAALVPTIASVPTVEAPATLRPAVTRVPEPQQPPSPENVGHKQGVISLGNWELEIKGWREVIAIQATGAKPIPKEGWKRVVVDADAKNVSGRVQNVISTLTENERLGMYKFDVESGGFTYKASLGAPMNSIEWGSTANIEGQDYAPGTTVPVQLVAEVPQNKVDYSLKTTILQQGTVVQSQITQKGEVASADAPNAESGDVVRKAGEAWVIPNFAKITFNRVRTEDATTIANGKFQEQFADFSLENDYGQDIKTRYGTELELTVYLKDGRVINGSQYYYSKSIEDVQSVAPGLVKNFDIRFGSSADAGSGQQPLYDVSGAKFVLIFKDDQSTNFVGSVFASWIMP